MPRLSTRWKPYHSQGKDLHGTLCNTSALHRVRRVEPYPDSRRNKRPRFDRKCYTERERCCLNPLGSIPSRTWRRRVRTTRGSQGMTKRCTRQWRRLRSTTHHLPPHANNKEWMPPIGGASYHLLSAKPSYLTKWRGKVTFPDAHPLISDSKDVHRKSNKYCKFHKEHDHLTEHGWELVVYINHLVCQGELEEYVKNILGCQQDKCKPATKGDDRA